MSKFGNLNIRKQLILSYGAIVIFSVIIGIYAITQIFSINQRYASSINVNKENLTSATAIMNNFSNLRLNVHNLIVYADNDNLLNDAKANIEELKAALDTDIENYGNSLSENNATQEQLSAVSDFKTALEEYNAIVDDVIDKVDNNKKTSASKVLDENKEISDYMFETAGYLYDNASYDLDTVTEESSAKALSSLVIMIFVIAAVVLISIMLAAVVSRILISSIKSLQNTAAEIAKGNLDKNIRVNKNNEIGALTNSLADVMETVNSLIDDINSTTELIDKGETDARIDPSNYSGGYEAVAVSINGVIDSLLSNIFDSISCMKNYADGNFDAAIRRFPGKMSIIHESMDKVKDNLKAVANDVNELIAAASDGNFDSKIDTENYSGDWKNITDGLNTLVEEIKLPISEVSSALDALSNGHLDSKIEKDFKGEFNSIKVSLNNTVNNLSSYIAEISDTLTKMSQQNLDVAIEREYIGDFKAIKDALRLIVEKFNMLIGDIAVSSEEVSTGAKQIADASMNLASGITKQATAVDALNSSITLISEQTAENTKYANKANELAAVTKENANSGSEQMHLMLKSMTEINNASNSISNIIKVIDEIAFQTNILALNASVEAARAGVHGKGFAVVAEEVRNLASRSQNAAKETTELVEDSVRMISEGSVIANNTFEALDKIVSEIDNMSELIQKCAESSKEQEKAIKDISLDVLEISDVMNSNSTVSEESAAASQELASHAELFNENISAFILKSKKADSEPEIAELKITEPEIPQPEKDSSETLKSDEISAKIVKPADIGVNTVSDIVSETKSEANPPKKNKADKTEAAVSKQNEIKTETKSAAYTDNKAKNDSEKANSAEINAAKAELHMEIAKLNAISDKQPKADKNQHLTPDKIASPDNKTDSKKFTSINTISAKNNDDSDWEFNRKDFGKY